jgi:eukaryotic-like serine/threonine-protein kinase
MVTKSGVKLLDFGLARLRQPGPASAFTTNSALPTRAPDLTLEGTILGTLQYMAPEQLEGKEADPKTDIFAFGSVLFEMVTGRKAFEGKTQAGLIGAILERDPLSVSQLQPATPPSLDRLLRRCLAKDPDDRWQTAADLKAELRWILDNLQSTPASAESTGAARRVRRNYWMPTAVACFLGMILFAVVAATLYWKEPAQNVFRFYVTLPEKTTFFQPAGTSNQSGPVVSPDGRNVAFTARDSTGKVGLWVQPLESLSARLIPGTEDVNRPFWSPDSHSIAFFTGEKIKKVDIGTGAVQPVSDQKGFTGGGSWNQAGVILFGSATTLFRVEASGGEPVRVTKLENQTFHRWPCFLPDGKHFLYYAGGAPETVCLWVILIPQRRSGCWFRIPARSSFHRATSCS